MGIGWKLLTATAVGAVGAAVAVPNLLHARKSANEAASAGALKTITSSQTVFREGDKQLDGKLDYGTLSELGNVTAIDSVLGKGSKQGYFFSCAQTTAGTNEFLWFANGSPQAPAASADRYFETSAAGVIFYTTTGSLAIDTSLSTLPVPGITPVGKGGDPVAPALSQLGFKQAQGEDGQSTFGVDVDTASYSLVSRYLRHNTLPPPELVRLEEMLNRFDVRDPAPPTDGRAFATRVEVAGCPWRPANRLVRIALRGREVDEAKRPPTNLVFLVDVSGSMEPAERLPLLKQALRLLVNQLGERDRVSVVCYAGAAGLRLPPTPGTQHAKILAAIDSLEAGGSTNGGAGIELAYRTAIESFVENGVNRVILCTDGDFNVGISTPGGIEAFIAEKRRSGVFLSALGFGVDAEGDRIMSKLADTGNGHYAAIENLREASRLLVKEVNGTLFTIAKDVKIQVEWNQERVKSYRLLGYEKRALANADFTNDKKDAGEIGAGHRVTALYEVEPEPTAAPSADARLLTLRVRWKQPDSEVSTGSEVSVPDRPLSFEDSSPDFKFAASVAAGALLLRRSPLVGSASWDHAIRWATAGLAGDASPDRAEWIDLLRRAAEAAPAPVGG